MHVQRCGDGLLLSQKQYMLEILDCARMKECKPCSTRMDTNPKVAAADGALVLYAKLPLSCWCSIVLDIHSARYTYGVQYVFLHIHDPREPHLSTLKRILRYIGGTLHLGLLL